MEKKPIEISFSYVFNPKEWRAISIFKKRSLELLDTKVFSDHKSNTKIEAKFELNQNGNNSLKVTLPSEELLKELYMAFRFFYLQKEPSNFQSISNIVNHAAANEQVNGFIRFLKNQWSGALLRKEIFGIYLNNRHVDAKRLLDLWFNAHYFHSDENKEKELNILNDALSSEFSRFLLAQSVYDACNSVISLYESIKNLENLEPKKT